MHKSFRHPWTLQPISVLKGIDFAIESKTIVGFLGGNGAGKTTSIKSILGLISINRGEIEILGKPNHLLEVKNNLGYLPERPFFYRYLNSEEFLAFYGQLSLGLGKKELHSRIDELLELVGLSHARKLLLNQFSKGMLQRIGMAQALIHKPKLLILDEPLSGLDPDGRYRMAEVIHRAHSEGTTIFFSSHLLDDVEKLCKHLLVLRDGKIQFSGLIDDFVSNGQRNFTLSFRQNGKNFSEKQPDLVSLQKRIDELRSGQAELTEISANAMSLEDAYNEFHKP